MIHDAIDADSGSRRPAAGGRRGALLLRAVLGATPRPAEARHTLRSTFDRARLPLRRPPLMPLLYSRRRHTQGGLHR